MFQALWLLLAYSYNIILVFFIAIHLFVGAIISFLVGLYIGVYLSQNYEVPRINEPRTLWEKFLAFLERNRRDPQKISVTNLLQPSTIKEFMLEEQPASKKNEVAFTPKQEELLENSKEEICEAESNHDQQEEEEEDEEEITGTEETDADFMATHQTSDITSLILTDNEIDDLGLAGKYKDIASLPTLESRYGNGN